MPGGGPSVEGVTGLQGAAAAGLLRANPVHHQLLQHGAAAGQLGLTSQQALALGLAQAGGSGSGLTTPATNLMAHPLLGLAQQQSQGGAAGANPPGVVLLPRMP